MHSISDSFLGVYKRNGRLFSCIYRPETVDISSKLIWEATAEVKCTGKNYLSQNTYSAID